MPRTRPSLGAPFGTDGPVLHALLDVLGDLYDLLDDRLPAPGGGSGGPVQPDAGTPRKVSEPAPGTPPAVADPAPDREDEDGPADPQPVPVAEPAPDAPPRVGRGSSRDAWAAWADGKVPVTDGMSRNDIIAACEAAGVLAKE